MQVPDKLSSAPATLRSIYQKYLGSFEQFCGLKTTEQTKDASISKEQTAERQKCVEAEICAAIIADDELRLKEQSFLDHLFQLCQMSLPAVAFSEALRFCQLLEWVLTGSFR